MKRLLLSVIALWVVAHGSHATEIAYTPTVTCQYAHRDTCDLYLDIYAPVMGSNTSIQGVNKPTILFIFGGGFMQGERNSKYYLPWFQTLAENGYHVVAIDYRLGLKEYHNAGINKTFVLATKKAIDMAVEDLFSATLWLIVHGSEYDIDARNIVVCGSSAGAITALQAEYELMNRTTPSMVLPDDFNYAGILSFAGALYSLQGKAKYDREPCPICLFQGTEDKIVPYNKIQIGRLFFGGTKPLAKVYKKKGYNYNAYRYLNHGHEIAMNMVRSFPEEIRFIETNVMRNQKRIVDASIDDPNIPTPDWGKGSYKGLYK